VRPAGPALAVLLAVLCMTASLSGHRRLDPQGSAVANGSALAIDPEVVPAAFSRESAVAAATVDPFRRRVEGDARRDFDAGIAELTRGNVIAAELAFKKAITPDDDNAAPLAYLAATYAASGHDAEAVSAWRMALVGGGDLPQIYLWLGSALARTGDGAAVESTYAEALASWPDDARFVIRAAAYEASHGSGRKAIARLEAYLAAGHDDPDALYFGVDCLRQLHDAKLFVRGAAEDLALARGWADRYARLNGPRAGIVRRWIEQMEAAR